MRQRDVIEAADEEARTHWVHDRLDSDGGYNATDDPGTMSLVLEVLLDIRELLVAKLGAKGA